MTRNKHLLKIVVAAAAVLALSACGSSDEPAAASGGSDDGTAESEGTPVAVAVGETDVNNQYMTVAPGTVPAGTITFTITNEGTKMHMFDILATDTPADQIEVGDDDMIMEPDDAVEVDEHDDIMGGDTVTLTVDLEPGHYVLECNEKGHYRMGMYTDFTVD